ncbi:MAG: DUF4293 domain-containing protein [Muribaculaceae bacterium]|nr:DUF4293 domain-containing protein [Muribaculaceae bacterium]MDE6486281.1 DUF4293 domain-containing protein [Muribaculaceae bacterium]
MQIQRIQTLLLLIAVALMCVFCLTPYAQTTAADGTVTDVFVKDTPVLLIVNACIAVLLFLNIFLYKDLKRQMSLTIVSALLLAGSAVACGFVVTVGLPDARLIWTGGVLLLVVTLILALCAYRCMRSDKRKLSSYDRLR